MTFKLIKAGVAALALLAVPFAAQAADMPIKPPYYKGAPRSVVSYYNWTGFYAGVNVGYGFGSSDWDRRCRPPASSRRASWSAARVGYNWQSGAIVYGIEGDFDWSNVKGSVDLRRRPSPARLQSDWLATFRGRVGYAFDRWLPYVTAGGAYGNVEATVSAPPQAFRPRRPATSSAGPSAPVSNTPSSAIGRPRSNISTSTSATSTPASRRS